MALDESENSNEFLTLLDEIPVLLDRDIKRYVDTGAPVTIDYRVTNYGSGFMVQGGSHC